jgi:hypothetical protein
VAPILSGKRRTRGVLPDCATEHYPGLVPAARRTTELLPSGSGVRSRDGLPDTTGSTCNGSPAVTHLAARCCQKDKKREDWPPSSSHTRSNPRADLCLPPWLARDVNVRVERELDSVPVMCGQEEKA